MRKPTPEIIPGMASNLGTKSNGRSKGQDPGPPARHFQGSPSEDSDIPAEDSGLNVRGNSVESQYEMPDSVLFST